MLLQCRLAEILDDLSRIHVGQFAIWPLRCIDILIQQSLGYDEDSLRPFELPLGLSIVVQLSVGPCQGGPTDHDRSYCAKPLLGRIHLAEVQ